MIFHFDRTLILDDNRDIGKSDIRGLDTIDGKEQECIVNGVIDKDRWWLQLRLGLIQTGQWTWWETADREHLNEQKDYWDEEHHRHRFS